MAGSSGHFRLALGVDVLFVGLLITLVAACAGGPFVGASPSAVARSMAPTDTLTPTPVPGAIFDDARAVAADPLGFIYVADAGKHVVIKMRPDGAVETVLGGPGSREGEFDEPSGLEPTNGLVLFVADAGNHRIQKFSRSYAYLGSIPLTPAGDRSPSSRVTYRRNDGDSDGFATGTPTAVASSDAKDLFAIDADRNVILKWDENLRLSAAIGDIGAGRGRLAAPVDLAMGPQSTVYVADRARREIVVYDAFGSVIRTIGEGHLEQLRAVAIGEEAIYVGHDAGLSAYAADGGLLRSFHIPLEDPLVDLAIGPPGTVFILTPRQLLTVTTD